MTRIRLNADGTRDLLSWSYFGDDDPLEAWEQERQRLEALNAVAREEWAKLTPEEQQRRTDAYAAEEQKQERQRNSLWARLMRKLYHQPTLPFPGLLQALAFIRKPACRQLLGIPGVQRGMACYSLLCQLKRRIARSQGFRKATQRLCRVFGLQGALVFPATHVRAQRFGHLPSNVEDSRAGIAPRSSHLQKHCGVLIRCTHDG